MGVLNIVLYQPEIPTNTGNIIRICRATGAKLHIIKPLAFDLHPRWFKRSSAGHYLSDIEHEVHASYQDFAQQYGGQTMYYITRYGMHNYADTTFPQDQEVFVMFGRESTGIPKSILQQHLPTCLRIPMTASTRSLNLANTVMLIAYEIQRQWGFRGMSKFEVQKGKNFLLT